MRQQEANQFDKGMSLDTNAIAMDNHTLSGALNATMITMNGNELVLQNDMGNAKVESAYLPSGFVPVGMQEFGGIVYVASYNPFTKESQIGSFPSPERNISSEDDATHPECQIKSVIPDSYGDINVLTTRGLLIAGPIRAGDKFKVTGSDGAMDIKSDVEANLITFKVIVLDADGSGIDITKDMKGYSPEHPMNFVNHSEFTTYKSKIAGEVWLQESLVIPSYISVSISSTANETSGNNEGETTNVRLSAEAYDSEGKPWTLTSLAGYDFEVKANGVEQTVETVTDGNGKTYGQVTVPLGEGVILSYDVIPKYSFGRIIALKQSGSVAVDLLGSGNIDIPLVRYYNDIQNDQFTLDYSINAYVENSAHSVSSVYLDLYDYRDCTVSGESITAGNAIQIPLSTSNTFGSYTAIIPYSQSVEDGGKILKGHMYIARIVALRSTEGVEGTVQYTSRWFVIITSAITNNIYMESASEAMFDCEVDTAPVIELDWDVNWEEKTLGESYKDELLPDYNTGTAIPTTLAEDETSIKLQTTRTGTVMLQYKAEVVVDTIDANFPFDIEKELVITIPEVTSPDPNAEPSEEEEEEVQSYSVYSTTIDYTGGMRTAEGLLQSEENIPIDNIENENFGSNQAWSNLAPSEGEDGDFVTNEDGTVQRILHYRLNSQYLAEVLMDPTTEQPLKVDFVGYDMPALVQYQTMVGADEETVRDMVGSDVFDEFDSSAAGVYTKLTPQTWWCWGTQKGKKKNTRERLMGLMAAQEPYDYCSQVVGKIPDFESLEDWGYGIFNTSTTNASWRYYSTVTMDYIHNSEKLYPYLFFWQGSGAEHSLMWRGNVSTNDYTIPIMLDASGEMYLIGQYRTGQNHGNMLKDIVKCFSNIYIYQQGQTVSYQYYKSSNDLGKYIYTNPYQMRMDCTYKATPTIRFMCGEDEYTGGNFSFSVDGVSTNIVLPIFQRTEFSKKDTDLKTFSTYVYSADQVAKNLEYLDAEPSLGNVAVVKNLDGTMHVVTTAVKVTNGVRDGVEPIDVSHVYFGIANGSETELFDCTKPLPNTIVEGTPNNQVPGKLIADAIRERCLRTIYSSENERNILIINKSAMTNKAARTCDIEIGEQKMKTMLSGIASKHLLKLPLFCGDNIYDMQITT